MILGFRNNNGQVDAARIARAQAEHERRVRLLDAVHDAAVRLSFSGHSIADVAAGMSERWQLDQLPRPEQLTRVAEALKDAADAAAAYARAAHAYNAGGDG